MKIPLIVFLNFIFFQISLAGSKNHFIYFHGLNSNIDSTAYNEFFRDLKKNGVLFRPKLPGHQKLNDQLNMEPSQTKAFILAYLKRPEVAKNLRNTTILAHSMSAILIKNNLPAEVKKKIKKIIYYAPSAPPKLFALFSLMVKWLPNQMKITSRSPKNLRLNDFLLVKNYLDLFHEVEIFLKNPTLLPNEEIRIHREDEVTNLSEIKRVFPTVKVNSKKCPFPKHVYFLNPTCV